MRIARQRRPLVGIDMSPLIDCVFQLLIFFLLSSTFLAPSMQLALPQAAAQDESQHLEIIVAVDAQGNFHLNANPIDPAGLKNALQQLVAQSQRKAVTIRADQDMPYKWFITALDAAQASGAAHVELQHEAAPP